jgi:uncharacterized membrane protein
MFAKEKIIVRLNQLFRNLLFHLVFWYLSLLLFVFLTGHEQLFSKYVELLNVKSVFFTNLFVAAIIAIFFTVLDGLFNDRLLRYSSTKIMMVVLPLLYLIIGTLLITLAPLSPKIILGLNNLDDFF